MATFVGPEEGASVPRGSSSSRSPTRDVRGSSSRPASTYWNSGMFVFKARRYLEELKRLAPDDISKSVKGGGWGAGGSGVHCAAGGGSSVVAARLDRLRRDGEDARSRWSCPSMPGWSDVGSWAALARGASRTDPSGNVIHGDVICQDTQRLFLYSGQQAGAPTVGTQRSRRGRKPGRRARSRLKHVSRTSKLW